MMYRLLAVLSPVAIIAAGRTHPAPRPAHQPIVQSTKYVAHLSGAMETPANTAKGTGTATFTLTGSRLRYTVDVHELSGMPTAAHIHVGAVGASGPPVYSFTITKRTSGIIAQGTIDLTKPASAGVSGDSLKALLNNGHAYVNVHTAAHPSGEIRGQVMKQ